MKKISFIFPSFLFALTLLCSCDEVKFQSPQPSWVTKNETVIPKNLRGNYVSGNDTLRITDKRIVDRKVNPEFDFNLSDSVLLKIYNHTYFLNNFDKQQKTWSVTMAKEENQKIYLYVLSFGESILLKRLKEITKVKETKDSTGKVAGCVINPTQGEFRRILEQNLFTKGDSLTRLK